MVLPQLKFVLILHFGSGVLACNYFKETSNAVKDEEYRVVDEEASLAPGIQAKSEELRETALGCNAWSG